jgi:hypothetical protein
MSDVQEKERKPGKGPEGSAPAEERKSPPADSSPREPSAWDLWDQGEPLRGRGPKPIGPRSR